VRRIFQNTVFRAWFFQGLLVGVLTLAVACMWRNAQAALAARGIRTGFAFLFESAGFGVSQSVIPFTASDSIFWAFMVGLGNTFAVSIASIVLATTLGTLIGVARLSSNGLIAGLARGYVEVFRNSPQLVQVIFWYGLVLALPPIRNSHELGLGFFISNRGFYIPWFTRPETGALMALGLALGFLCALILLCLPGRRRRRGRTALASAIGVPLCAFALSGFDVDISVPVLKGFNFRGGSSISPEFLALFLGLGLYIAAFVAEIVRAGLSSVDPDQVEAAIALGIPAKNVLLSVKIPQALRVIIPPVAAQYISLVKNSSLGVAIGYPELFNLSNSITTLTGQAIECVAIMGALYLLTAIATSAALNLFNRASRIVE